MVVLSLLLSGCGGHTHSFSKDWSYDGTYHFHKATCGHDVVKDKKEHVFNDWETILEASEIKPGLKRKTCGVCQYYVEEIIPTIDTNIPTPTGETLSLDIYATNDIHGQIENDGNRMDIITLGTYMKNKGLEDNTLLLDQGDSWQGSIYSNHNRGALINDVMCIAQYDARTVGNHDFDWGIEPLKENTSREYNGYTIPVLAANVYDYDFAHKIEGDIQQSDIGQKTITYTLKNGLKVGIVGVIGKDQITSITSSYIQDICFKDHIPIIKEEATKLRNSGCDIVIASAHTGQEDLLYNNLENYVDLVLCGHTHRNEYINEGNLYYVQFGSYGYNIGHITLTYDLGSKKVIKTDISSLSRTQVMNEGYEPDQEITKVVGEYNKQCEQEAEVVLASNTSQFSQSEEAVNLMCTAIMDKCIEDGYDDVILSYCNTARKALPYGTWKYADIYNSFPFDNTIYIVNIKGKDILDEIKVYNNVCYSDSFDYKIDPNKYYQIACLDYLLYHTNNNRYYNYFPSFDGETVAQLDKNYRHILRDWLMDNGYNNGKQLSRFNYSGSLDKYNRSLLTEI